jgi:hypothetical protein
MSFNMDDYVDVAERIRLAKELYPEMSLQPANPLAPFTIEEIQGITYVCYVAAFYRDPADPTPGIGVAWEVVPGTTPYTRGSELMNAETSAWGRAILAVGLPSKKVASREEVQQAKGRLESWTAKDKSPEMDGWSTVPDNPGHESNSQTRGNPKCAHGEMKWWSPKDKPDAGSYYCPLPKDAPGKCDRVKA